MKARSLRPFFAVLLSVLSLGAAAQNTFLWPIQGKKAGEDILYRPGENIGDEPNFNNLVIAAPLGTKVVAPDDCTLEFFSVGYYIDLLQCIASRPAGADVFNFDTMIAALQAEGNVTVPAQYVSGRLVLRLKDGRRLYLDGLRGDIVYDEAGMSFRRGDVLGTVGYAYRSIKEPHIFVIPSGTWDPKDLMKRFGL